MVVLQDSKKSIIAPSNPFLLNGDTEDFIDERELSQDITVVDIFDLIFPDHVH